MLVRTVGSGKPDSLVFVVKKHRMVLHEISAQDCAAPCNLVFLWNGSGWNQPNKSSDHAGKKKSNRRRVSGEERDAKNDKQHFKIDIQTRIQRYSDQKHILHLGPFLL